MDRRTFLRQGLTAAGALSLGVVSGQAIRIPWARAGRLGGADAIGVLLPPNALGLRLPEGFTSRIVAVSGVAVSPSTYVWPHYPDGGAVFPANDGGWVYVANSERRKAGGVGAIRFGRDGSVVNAYSILTGTDNNCAGGPTPWGTWLSCEEVDGGHVYECNPMEPWSEGVVRPALGTFYHEAVAVDPVHGKLYLTEDKMDGLLYRFVSRSYPNLKSGHLEAAQILDPDDEGNIRPGQMRKLAWHKVPHSNPPRGGVDSSRRQVPMSQRSLRFQMLGQATPFKRGEGCWYEGGMVYFTTTDDSRVWALNAKEQTIEILYDFATSDTPEISGADNIYASPRGDVFVAEDGGNMQIVAITPQGAVKPVIEVVGHGDSEVTGPALSPDGTRMYFSSQRGPGPQGKAGITYEVAGPFAPASSDRS